MRKRTPKEALGDHGEGVGENQDEPGGDGGIMVNQSFVFKQIG